MAQISKGVKLEWGAPGASDVEPTVWKKIPDITSIPSLIGAPSTKDATTLADEQKVYVEGLPDAGGTLAFSANFTPELAMEAESVIESQDTANPYFRVVFPIPLNMAYVWRGTLAPVSNDDIPVDSILTCKLNITPSTIVELKKVTA